ncbi:putative Ubiquitin domain-containing protein [Arabidopsis thaliana]
MRKLSLQKKSQVDITFSIHTLSFSIHSSSVCIDTMISVFFETQRGSPFSIEVGYFDTVLEIKEKIEKYQRIPVSKQTLFFQGNVLQDHLDIEKCQILDNSRLQLFISSPGNNDQNRNNQVFKTEQSPPSNSIEQIINNHPQC